MTTRRTSVREYVVDAATVGVAAFVAVALAGDAEQSGRLTGGALFRALVIGLAGCIALLWRRRHPVGVALLLSASAIATDFGYAAVLIAVYTVAKHRRPAVVAAVAAVDVLAHLTYSVLRPDPALTLAAAVLVNAVGLAIAIALGSSVRAFRQRGEALRERAEQAMAEAARQAERVRVLERGRIAREMHDALAHRISIVSLHAGALEVRPDLPQDEVVRAAATIRRHAYQALEDLREILGVLRADEADAGLRPQRGLADLESLIAESRSAGTVVEVENDLAGAEPAASVSRTVYRIVQEGLTNARKHVPGATVHLRVNRTPSGDLHVWMRNPLDGGGTGPAIPGSRNGLVGLAERVSLAGGRLEHGVRREADGAPAFHLEAWLPWLT
jgi:signal transduction histidine kinase